MGRHDRRDREAAQGEAAAKIPDFATRQRIICLDIPDDYGFMDPELIHLLTARMARHMPKT